MGQATAEKTAARKKAFLEKLESTLGNVSLACKEIGIDRATYYKWKQRDKAFAKKAEEVNEMTLDFAENALKKQIQSGDTTAIIFFLKTKGKDRGYVERTLIDQKTEISVEKPMTQAEAAAFLESLEKGL